MNRSSHSGIAIATAILIYALLIIPVGIWPKPNYLAGLIWTGLYSFMACGLALEVTELLFAFLWPPRCISLAPGIISRKNTAVLMTVCDDIDLNAIAALLPLSRAGYSVFLLDDSRGDLELPTEIKDEVVYRRRTITTGAKAGNLNDWLDRYGDRYLNIVLLDSDSTMSIQAVDILVQASEHPSNANVAIFQSKTEPHVNWNLSRFSAILGIGARPRARVLERVHGRFGILVSFGHNQLIRIKYLRLAGGFSEEFSSEDTALSLSVSALGLKTELVDTWSVDSEPSNIDSWVRRTTRWARQTVELFCSQWSLCPIRLKILMCRHLLSYMLPSIGLTLLVMSIIAGPRSPHEVVDFFWKALRFEEGYRLYGFSIWSTLLVFMSSISLRFALALAEGVSLVPLVVSVIVGPLLQAILVIPVTCGMIASALGCKAKFIPTNIYCSRRDTRRQIIRAIVYCTLAWTIGALLWVAMVVRPGAALVGFNGIWVLAFLLAPFALLIGSNLVKAKGPAKYGKNK